MLRGSPNASVSEFNRMMLDGWSFQQFVLVRLLSFPPEESTEVLANTAYGRLRHLCSACPVIGTKITGKVDSWMMSFSVLIISVRTWRLLPRGTISLPPTESCPTSGCGMWSGAAVTTIASNGAFSGHPV